MSAPVLDLETTTMAEFLHGEDGRAILLNGVSWAVYESLLQRFWENSSMSFTYDSGKLEIMPKSRRHEKFSRSIHNFVVAYSEAFEVMVESAGSTTFRRKAVEKGVEPDECYYVQSASSVIGQNDVSPEDYLTPDLAVEIDVTTESLDKFNIYAALGVPELWVYDGKEMKFYELAGDEYQMIENSRALPLLTTETLSRFIEQSQTEGQTAALRAFRRWLGEQQQPSESA